MTFFKTKYKKFFKNIIISLYFYPLRIRELSTKYNRIKKNGFSVKFLNEGSKIIKMPKISLLEFIFINKKLGENIYLFFNRPNKEALLRKIVFELYQSGYIKNNHSIIDIGCWLCDNSIIWAQYLNHDAILYAIDPSKNNIAFGEILADLNKVKNIKFVTAVCAEKIGINFDYKGNIDHANFIKTKSNSFIKSSTLDQIAYKERIKIGFMHLDVEGYEFNVIKGAKNIIKRDMPVIIFEQHISKEKVNKIIKYLAKLGYKTFMINEVIPDCDCDCRNFISIPSYREMPNLTKFDQSQGRYYGIFGATLGDSLIEV